MSQNAIQFPTDKWRHTKEGDIVGLLDNTGTEVVKYTYDAWGKPLSTTGSLASTLGTIQPFRYRGYVYDVETGLYYLRSRYFYSSWQRFITPDCLFKSNLFCYCNNSPLILSDASGYDYCILEDPVYSNRSLLNRSELFGGGGGGSGYQNVQDVPSSWYALQNTREYDEYQYHSQANIYAQHVWENSSPLIVHGTGKGPKTAQGNSYYLKLDNCDSNLVVTVIHYNSFSKPDYRIDLYEGMSPKAHFDKTQHELYYDHIYVYEYNERHLPIADTVISIGHAEYFKDDILHALR